MKKYLIYSIFLILAGCGFKPTQTIETSKAEFKIMRQGRIARTVHGFFETANPYPEGSKLNSLWFMGWDSYNYRHLNLPSEEIYKGLP